MKRIGVIDIVSHTNKFGLYGKITTPSLSSIMPQVIAVWLKEMGHEVFYKIITEPKDFKKQLNLNLDVVFISSFTFSAYLAYALSNFYRKRGAITILGGPHARSFAEDSKKYFDYVIGLCDKDLIKDLMSSIEPVPNGQYLTADRHPTKLASVEDRWEFIKTVIDKKLWFVNNTVPLIGSTGCPNKCEFCIDSQFPYWPMDWGDIEKDLIYLNQFKNTMVVWHDPNFAIQFDKWVDLIKRSTDSIKFLGELSLSNLTKNKAQTLAECGFIGVAPGIESWTDFNHKTIKKSYNTKMDKVYQTANHLNMISKYIPIVQANIMFGLDCDAAEESFSLTKEFVNLTPSIYSNLQTLTIFGNSTPTYESFKKQDRLLNVPYNLMDGFSSTNLKINCEIKLFYDLYYDLLQHYNSLKMTYKRITNSHGLTSKILQLSRSIYNGKQIKNHYKEFINKLKTKEFIDFYNGESSHPPKIYLEQIKNELGELFEYLPKSVIENLYE